MSRKLREISLSGLYHIMLRGVNKQRIFEHIEDYDGWVCILKRCMYTSTKGEILTVPTFDLYAYCFMDNHIHMLIGERDIPIGSVIRRVGGHYAQWFNHRYHRVGHLFQDRYNSEACNDKQYFFTLLDYIHNNPIKAGLCEHPEDYRWSSYNELSDKKSDALRLCTFNHPFGDEVSQSQVKEWCLDQNRHMQLNAEVIGESIRKTVKNDIKELHKVQQENQLIPQPKITHWGQTLLCNLRQLKKHNDVEMLDKAIVDTLLGLSGVASISDFQQLDKKTMRSTLAIIRDAGISIRRLSRISGISEGIIRNCKNPKNLPDYTLGSDPIV